MAKRELSDFVTRIPEVKTVLTLEGVPSILSEFVRSPVIVALLVAVSTAPSVTTSNINSELASITPEAFVAFTQTLSVLALMELRDKFKISR